VECGKGKARWERAFSKMWQVCDAKENSVLFLAVKVTTIERKSFTPAAGGGGGGGAGGGDGTTSLSALEREENTARGKTGRIWANHSPLKMRL